MKRPEGRSALVLSLRYWVLVAVIQNFLQTIIAAPIAACNEAGLRAAIEAGGVISFPCDVTIAISSMITISNQVTLDANGRAVTLTANSSTRLFQIIEGGDLSLVHLTIADGLAINGGAILNDGGRVFAVDCVFQNNRATGFAPATPAEGGAIFNNGELAVTNCEFRGNVAQIDFAASIAQPGVSAAGGAIKSDGALTVNKTSFLLNSATGGKGGDGSSLIDGRSVSGSAGGNADGGAIYAGSVSQIIDCTFSNNVAQAGMGGQGNLTPIVSGSGGGGGAGCGGALFVSAATNVVFVSSCAFMANATFGGAGGLSCPWDSTVAGGPGGTAGGAIHLLSGNLNLINSSLYQNQGRGGPGADGRVGGAGNGGLAAGTAIFAEAGFLNATNITVFANEAHGGNGGFLPASDFPGGSGGDASGAGIFVRSGTASIAHGTIALNSAVPGVGGLCTTAGGVKDIANRGTTDGAGIRNISGSVAVANSILSTNFVIIPGQSASVSANCAGSITDLGFNISSDWSAPFLTSGIDPKLGAFDLNGGSTKNFALLPDSPAIDFSNPLNSPPTDQRGYSRSAGYAPDAGAFERTSDPAEELNVTELRSRIAQGGSVVIDKPGTFVVGATITIAKNVTIDASHAPAQFDGRGGVQLFHVLPGISFTLINACVSNGRAVGGGGLLNDYGFVLLIGCTFSNNVSIGQPGSPGTNSASKLKVGGAGSTGLVGRGGAVLNTGMLVVSNSVFVANGSYGGRGGDGGIGGDSTRILLNGYACRTSDRGASGGPGGSGGVSQGGAVWNSGSARFVGTLFRDNKVIGGLGGTGGSPGTGACFGFNIDPAGSGGIGGSSDGGAIYSTGALNLERSGFIGNRAWGGAGGFGGDIPNGLSLYSEVAGAGGKGGDAFGGGIASRGAVITNVTFGFNTAIGGRGGSGGSGSCTSTNGAGGDGTAGAIDANGTNTIQNCTLVGNAAYPGPGGTYNYCNLPPGADGRAFASTIQTDSAGGRQLLAGSIIVVSDAQTSVIGTLLDNGYNLSNDPQIAFTATNSRRGIDPLLFPLDESGALPFFRPALESPARDAMPAALAPATDERGVRRPVGPAADIGAIEIAMAEIPAVIALGPANSVALAYKAHPSSDYVLFESLSLDSWTATTTNRAGADGSLVFGPIDARTGSKFFFSREIAP